MVETIHTPGTATAAGATTGTSTSLGAGPSTGPGTGPGATTGTTAAAPSASDMVVIDMGTQESSRVRKLCRGRGRLLHKVNGVLTELRAHDKVAANAQVVVVVVREETDIDDYFDDDDYDDDDYDDDYDD